MTHIINHLQFQFNCADEDQAFNFRHNFGVTFQEQITDITDSICTKYVGAEDWLRIDKLEIDLGYFSPGSFDTNFAAVFKSKFEKELTQKLAAISSTEKKVFQQLLKLQLFQYFLLTGTLPWWAEESEINLDKTTLELLTDQHEKVKRFFYHYQNKKQVWTRVAFQLNKKSKAQIILLVDELKTVKNLFFKWIQQLNILLVKETITEINVDDETIENIILVKAPEIFQHIKNENVLLQIFNDDFISRYTIEPSSAGKIIENNKTDFFNTYHEISNGEASKNVSAETGIQQQQKQKDFLLNNEVIHVEEDEKNTIEKYIVKQAGIVLLAPFLKDLFTNLHLLQNAEWKTKDAQYRAVHLLKFLSTGTQKMPEYNLTLEKIICGLSLEEPLPLNIELEEHEMSETVSLLESVIEHWKALKSTSVNGLRESFLKRDGLLSAKENDWLLQVERKTLDILIDSIPWGYSTIALPWNYYLIYVEW